MSSQSVDELLADARSNIERLEPAAALQATREGAVLVDTRCGELRDRDGYVPGSVHVPLSVLYWRLDPRSDYRDADLADPRARVILLCEHGYSSSLAAATLRLLGYERAADVVGGFEAWAAAGLPVERRASG
jgi:rhodanese-related sulfurtransferase